MSYSPVNLIWRFATILRGIIIQSHKLQTRSICIRKESRQRCFAVRRRSSSVVGKYSAVRSGPTAAGGGRMQSSNRSVLSVSGPSPCRSLPASALQPSGGGGGNLGRAAFTGEKRKAMRLFFFAVARFESTPNRCVSRGGILAIIHVRFEGIFENPWFRLRRSSGSCSPVASLHYTELSPTQKRCSFGLGLKSYHKPPRYAKKTGPN